MRAAIMTEPAGPVTVVDDVEIARPQRGEALVAVIAAGVCGSDLALQSGRMPYPTPVVLGHEAVGRVLAVGGDGGPPVVGDRVVLWMRPPCRACAACLRGDAALCERSGAMSAHGTLPAGRTGLRRGGAAVYRGFGIGAFAEQLVMPLAGLVPVPDDVPDEVAALFGCGVATGAGALLNVARPQPGAVVVVFGAGGVGLAAVMAAAATGAGGVVAVDPIAQRRDEALRLGATHALAGGDREALRAQLREVLGDTAVDVVIDAAGRRGLVELGWRTVRQGGTVVAVGLADAGARVSLPAQRLALSHKRLLGCFMGGIDPQRDLPRLFTLWRRGVLPVEQLVTARRPLTEAADALADLAATRGLRTLLRP